MNTKTQQARPFWNQIMINAIKLGLAFVAGLAAAVFIFLALGLISNAFAHEVDPDGYRVTREATLGEQDRSLNYPITHTPSIIAPSGEQLWGEAMDQARATQCKVDCSESNAYRIVIVRSIAAEITKNPEAGHWYKDTLLTLRNTWCTC